MTVGWLRGCEPWQDSESNNNNQEDVAVIHLPVCVSWLLSPAMLDPLEPSCSRTCIDEPLLQTSCIMWGHMHPCVSCAQCHAVPTDQHSFTAMP
jgi:hypothetical protein